MNKWHLIWKIPCALLGVTLGLVLLLLVAAAGIIMSPAARTAILEKGVAIANERTDLDIDLSHLYLSPFHHSPFVLYRAYKMQDDLTLQLELDSLFIGHRGQDTLIYLRNLRLNARLLTSQGADTLAAHNLSSLLAVPIVVEQLHLTDVSFHSDSLIAAVGIDVLAGMLDVSSPGMSIAEGHFPLHDLSLDDAYVGVTLRDTPRDTTSSDPMALAFDVPDGVLRNIHFALYPLGLNIRTDVLATNVLADVGNNLYDARSLNADNISLTLGKLYLPFDTLYGDARVDLDRSMITSNGLHARSDHLGAKADLSATTMNLESLRVDVVGDAEYQGSVAHLNGYYDIDDERYDMRVSTQKVNLAPFLKDSKRIVIAGDVHAAGKGVDISSPKIRSKVQMHLTDAIYENINVSGVKLDAELASKTLTGTMHLPVSLRDSALSVKANTNHVFSVTNFTKPERMQVNLQSQMRNVHALVAGEKVNADLIQMAFVTDSTTSLDIDAKGLAVDVRSPMHVLKLLNDIQPLLSAVKDSAILGPLLSFSDLTMLDTIRRLIPDNRTNIVLAQGSPLQPFISRTGLDIDTVDLALTSDSLQTNIALSASIPEINHPEDSTALRLPAARAKARVSMREQQTSVVLDANSKITDGAMAVHDIRSDVGMNLELERTERRLNGSGRLTLDNLGVGEMNLGSRQLDIDISPSSQYADAFKVDVRPDDIPLALVDSIIHPEAIDFDGTMRAKAVVDGLPSNRDISAELLPIDVWLRYKPYNVRLTMGETPIIMEHNQIDFHGLPLYGVDSTFLTLDGGLNIDSMRLNIALASDSFVPVRLLKEGPLPVYGDLAAGINGTVTGALDSILADIDVTILPGADLTYPIDSKNLAQVKPHGTVNVRYDVAQSSLNLGGRLDVDDGTIRYSPKIYPMMPFHVDSGSHVAFQGPLGQTMLDVSASQHIPSNVQAEGEEMRRVDFTTGVRVRGVLDSIGLGAIGFFLEAPDDEAVTEELAAADEETRESMAAALLATGMYMGESNVATNNSGYALTSILNSRIDAAMTNSKMGKWVDIGLTSSQNERASGKTNDYGVSLSKSFFSDRFRVTVGATISENPEVSNSAGLFGMVSADYKLTKDGNVMLRAFTQRDYNNIFEGDLQKSGIGVRATNEWQRRQLWKSDTITRVFGLTADADVAYRSNNSIGPNLTLKSSIRNLMGRNETFTLKGYGAYYWALRDRNPGDPKKTDTYKLGADAALIFPYLHWVGNDTPDGDTRYRLGYRYENIAGGYGVHKFMGSLTYFIRSPHSKYITHAFTPFSLSLVRMKAETDSLLNKAAEFPQLMKLLAGDEFIPSVGYEFTYNDYRAKRVVNTMFDLEIKESGNLINAAYCLFGYKWDDKRKPLGSITFDQFVKLSLELRNKFNITDQVSIATRLFAGANLPMGNSVSSPLSEAFYAGGTNSMRAASPYSYGPGNFFSAKYTQNFFHAGDVKLEANAELRFPIVWKLYGAFFVDAGNVWSWINSDQFYKDAGYEDYVKQLQLAEELYDGIYNNPYLARQIALGTGTGLRLDIDGLVIRLDIGVGIHAPYLTYKYNDEWKVDYDQPIKTYYNMPSVLDGLKLNFGIGYPF